MQEHILSRILAIIIATFPLAAVGFVFDKIERETIHQFSTLDDLRAYAESMLLESYWVCFGIRACPAQGKERRSFAGDARIHERN